MTVNEEFEEVPCKTDTWSRPSNSLRFSWTGNIQEDDDAAGFSIISRFLIMIFCFLQRRYQCLPPPLHLCVLPCKGISFFGYFLGNFNKHFLLFSGITFFLPWLSFRLLIIWLPHHSKIVAVTQGCLVPLFQIHASHVLWRKKCQNKTSSTTT